MDIIELKGIQLQAIIGVYPKEKETPQPLVINLAYAVPVTEAAINDSLNQTIDYDQIITHVIEFVQNNPFELIETLAERLSQSLLAHFPTQWIKLNINKPEANPCAKAITLTIERQNRY